VTRDVKKIVDLVVPDGRSGLLNLMSTRQVSNAVIQMVPIDSDMTSVRFWRVGEQNVLSTLLLLTRF